MDLILVVDQFLWSKNKLQLKLSWSVVITGSLLMSKTVTLWSLYTWCTISVNFFPKLLVIKALQTDFWDLSCRVQVAWPMGSLYIITGLEPLPLPLNHCSYIHYLDLFIDMNRITNSSVVKSKVEVDTCTCIISLCHPVEENCITNKALQY